MCANQIVPNEYIAKIKPEQLEALVKNGTFTKNADGTYTSNVPIGNAQAVKADNEVKGLAVESAEARTAIQKPEQPKIALADNDMLQKQKLEKYKRDYAELYKKDPSILKSDIADVVYAKEKAEIAAYLENGAKSVDGQIMLKDRYMKEFATEAETEKFKKALNEKIAYYSDPKNAELARLKYIEAFHEVHKENYKREKEPMTPPEIKLLAHREALKESFQLEDSTYSKMANSLIQNRYLNHAINTTEEYQKKYEEALAKGDTDKAAKIKEKAAKELVKAKKEEIKDIENNKEDLINYMAEAKLNRELAEERVKNRVLHWDKDGSWKEDDNNKALTKEMREFVKENTALFADEVQAGEQGDFTQNGKSYKFNSQKFKDYFVGISNENEFNTTEGHNPYHKADYMTSIINRKRGMDHAKKQEYENELIKQYPEYANPETRAEFLRKNPDIEMKLGHMTAKDKQKDRFFQGKCAKICGLDKEYDKTNLKRLGHVAKQTFKGALAGFAGGCLMEGFACTKVVNGKYADIIKYSKDVAYQYKQAYSQNVTVSGTVEYEQPVTVEGYAKYQDAVVIDEDIPYHTEVTVDGYTPYEGDVNWHANGETTSSVVNNYWNNGELVDSTKTNIIEPWEASGTEHYSGEAYFKKTVGVDGTVHFERTVPVEGEVYYKQTVNAKGEVQFEKTVVVEGEVQGEGTVTAEGEVEAKGTTSARHKFDMSVPIGAAISGGITGAIQGLFTMKKVKYHGGTPEVAARQKILERSTKPDPIAPTPIQIPIPEITPPEIQPIPTPQPKFKGTTEHKVEMWDLNKHGQYWNQMAALYETKDGKPLTFKQAMEIVHFYNDAYDKAHTLNGLPNGGKIDLGLFDMNEELTAKYQRRKEIGKFEKIARKETTFVQTKFNPLTGKWEAIVRTTDGKEIGRGENVDKTKAQSNAITQAGVEPRNVEWEDI